MSPIVSRELGALGRRLGRALLLDRPLRFWLDEVAPLASRRELRARVVAAIDETHDVKTFVLAPRTWPGHTAGQYVPVEVELDGVRVRRCYSISSRPDDRNLAITVKRVEGGRVSTWMHDHLRVGTVVRLGEPAGEFTFTPDLEVEVPPPLLLLSGGSGATPVMAILRALAAQGATDSKGGSAGVLPARRPIDDVVYLHAARSAEDVIFADELATLAKLHPGLRVVLHLDDAHPGSFLDVDRLRELVPDFAERETYLCGPTGMMNGLAKAWAGNEARLHQERFVAAPTTMTTERGARVFLTGKDRVVTTTGEGSLLEELERAGERPEHGCRMGICNSCRCRKRSGVVEDTTTGLLSTEPDEDIRLCVSVARSDIELAL